MAGVHPTTQSYLTPSANFVRKLAVAEDKAHDLAAPNEMLGKLSPAVDSRVKKKNAKYKIVTEIIDLQIRHGIRHANAAFVAAVASHTGEISEGVTKAFAFIADAVKAGVLAGLPRRDGRSASQVAAAARREVRSRFFCALAKGFGFMLATSGVAGNKIAMSA